MVVRRRPDLVLGDPGQPAQEARLLAHLEAVEGEDRGGKGLLQDVHRFQVPAEPPPQPEANDPVHAIVVAREQLAERGVLTSLSSPDEVQGNSAVGLGLRLLALG